MRLGACLDQGRANPAEGIEGLLGAQPADVLEDAGRLNAEDQGQAAAQAMKRLLAELRALRGPTHLSSPRIESPSAPLRWVNDNRINQDLDY